MNTEPTPATESLASSFVDRELHVQTVCQMIFAAIAVGAALYWLRPVLLPFILALFFVFGLAPVLDYIQRRMKAPRSVAVGIAFMIGLALISILMLLIWLSVESLLNNADNYRQRLDNWIAYAAPWFDLSGGSEPPLEGSAADGQPVEATIQGANGTAPPARAAAANMQPTAGALRGWISGLSPMLMDFFSSALMVVIFMFFLLLGGSTDIVPRTGFWIEVEASIRQYIVAKTVISALTGAVFGLVLWLFGIPLALVFGILAFLLNYIPNVGPVIAGLLPVPLILLAPNLSAAGMVAAIVLTVAIQFVSGNIIEPKVMGSSVELHPVAILITLLFWGLLWGIVGMFLATPITAAIKILLERFEHTKVIAQMLEGDLSGLSFMHDAAAPAAVADDSGSAQQV